MTKPEGPSTYERIYDLVRQIPSGKVATYGQVAQVVGGCTARMVGYAMSALKSGAHPDVPWQRVINRQGRISIHDAYGGAVQRQILESEGVVFDDQDRVDFAEYGWLGTP
jgi:methylated-DNA-protein-cysteine methyltransferase related protein